ncbi:hypothetical protein A3K93_03695 [Acinetobacter sp. NCu2D-2]|uniref:hypothetical protein n=1 Tax=Acinetobacter sp. NCu2D-2 TaxID=1608473 RepID=UPI0007CDF41B|nr:hypothetical protein [Acinetobacter sp. NCu2D-2]ANF81383.1 hypothetical protein A3K93_03695 [Acinetobacter sp. NCu2D-2]
MKIGLLLLMVVFVAVLIGLFVLSYKMLNKVRREEQLTRSIPQYELHPKLKAEMQKRKNKS